jgi:hypothetical protein
MLYLLRAGVRAGLTRENNLAKGQEMYAEWEEQLMKALHAADRQQEEFTFTPTQTILGSNGTGFLGVGPSQPYGPAFFNPGYGG